jgi:hypothetical protein
MMMALTNEELESIKTKIETDKVRPIKAIRDLFPDENLPEVRNQLFELYDRAELLEHSRPEPLPEPTKEEKIARLEQQIARIEQRKARLQQEKTDLEG